MHRIRPRTCVLSGATIGLLAGAAVYGVVSVAPPSPSALAPVAAARALPRARAADCAPGQSLQHGVCIIHKVRTVIVAAPGHPPTPAPTKAANPAGTGEAQG